MNEVQVSSLNISFVELKCAFFSKTTKYRSAPKFFLDVGENTCSIQPALKSTASAEAEYL